MDYRGRTPKKLGLDWGGGSIPAISARNVRMGSIDFTEEFHVGSEALYRRWMSQGDMEEGDSLITTEAPLGNVAAVPGGRKYILSQRTVLLRPKPELFDKRFFTTVLQSPRFQRLLLQNATGSTALGIQRRRLEQLVIPVPPLAEQGAIAQALADADELITTLEQAIAKKQAVKQGMMQQLLTGQTRLPGFGGPWKPLTVASRSTIKARIGWQGLKTNEYRNSGTYRLVGGTEFAEGRIDWNRAPFVDEWRYEQDASIQLRVGDVLLTKDGTIGKTAFVDLLPGPATLNSGVFVIRPVRGAYDAAFLFFMLRSRVFDEFLGRLSAGSTISHLYQRDLVTLVLRVPPTVEEQHEIARILVDLEEAIAVLRGRLVKARAIKAGMMQELLTGRVRLPVESAES